MSVSRPCPVADVHGVVVLVSHSTCPSLFSINQDDNGMYPLRRPDVQDGA
jgi:hypothetical protein